jgi:hypothetical protein
MEKVLFYSENGDVCHYENGTMPDAKKWLKEKGYKKAYIGRKFTSFGIRVIVGINDSNLIPLSTRRKNGLFNAREISL